MTVTTTTVQRAEAKIPQDIMKRFLRSLGFPISDDARLSVYRSSLSGSSEVEFSWEVDETQTAREVQAIALSDIEFIAGMAELAKKAEE